MKLKEFQKVLSVIPYENPMADEFLNRFAEHFGFADYMKNLPSDDLEALVITKSEEDTIKLIIFLVQYLKTRKETFNEDLEICQEIVERLGYERTAISELFLMVYADVNNTPDTTSVMFKLDAYKIT
jgi:hypothetical protein